VSPWDGGQRLQRGRQLQPNYAIALGIGSAAIGSDSIAIGDGAATSTNLGPIAIGRTSNAGAQTAIALGWSAAATSTQSIAIGQGAAANTGAEAIAIGGGVNATAASTATAQGAISIGASDQCGSCGGESLCGGYCRHGFRRRSSAGAVASGSNAVLSTV